MPLGKWVGGIARDGACARRPAGAVIAELPEACGPERAFLGEMIEQLVRERNQNEHVLGGVKRSDDESHEKYRELRPRFEAALRRSISRAVTRWASPSDRRRTVSAAGERRFKLHSCMGARIARSGGAYEISTTLPFEENWPFVVSPDGARRLYLWPLLLAGRSHKSLHHTLWTFEELANKRQPYLTQINYAALDTGEPWTPAPWSPPATSHAWLIEHLRTPEVRRGAVGAGAGREAGA